MQNLLEMRTIFFCTAMVACAFALLLLWIVRHKKTYPGFGDWAASEAAFTLIFLWQAFRESLHGPVPVVAGNAVVCCAMILLARGMRKFCGRPFHVTLVYCAAALYLWLIAYYYFLQESFWMRTLLAGAYLAAMGLYTVIPFLQGAPEGRRFGYRFTASALLFGVAIGAVRVAAVARMPEVKSIFFPAKINTAYCLTDLVFQIAISLSFFLLTYERQVADLREYNDRLAHEVDERHKAEQALCAHQERLQAEIAEQTATLRASEERYRALFDRNLAAVFHASGERILDCNQAMCRMLGYSREELLALNLRTLRFPALEPFEREETGGFREIPQQELELLRKDGRSLTVLLSRTLIADAASPAPIVSGVMLDISDVRLLQQRLSQAQRLEALGLLSGGVAHDFNNILMSIYSYTEIAQGDTSNAALVQDAFREIRIAANRAASLTQQLLAFGRKQIMAPQPVRLDAILGGLQAMLRRVLGKKIELVIEKEEALWLAIADPSQIEQIVLNLVVNARDAMPQGGSVLIQLKNCVLDEDFANTPWKVQRGQYVALRVTDTGCGISRATQARIFEPFFTTKSGLGSGLGLSTVYGIVKQSNGYVIVDSEPGKGATFTVYLPRTEAPVAALEAATEAASPLPSASRTILLVEDEEPLRVAIAEYLSKHGFRVVPASTAEEAIRICEILPPDAFQVLLTDVVMPGKSGAEVAACFRRLCPQGRVVFMSGYADDILSRAGIHPEAITVLSKPFDLKTLAVELQF